MILRSRIAFALVLTLICVGLFSTDAFAAEGHGTKGIKELFAATGWVGSATTRPPRRSSISMRVNQSVTPGPVAMACQISSGVPGASAVTSKLSGLTAGAVCSEVASVVG